MPSGLPLVHLHPASVVELGRTNKVPVSVRDRLKSSQGREALVESLSTPPSIAGRDASDGRKQRCWPLFFFFFSLTDGNYSKSQTHTFGLCVLKNWDKFDPQSLKKTHLTFFCKSAWPQYPLEGGRQWLVEGSLNCDTVLQLDQFCIRQGKWV